MSQKRQGLRKLSPDLIAKARDDTATQVTRILLTFVGTAVFCVLSLLTPDSALLAGNEKVTVPLAGPVSFFGFILLGPAVLIVLRVYLQIYVEHERRLDRIARRMPMVRAPSLLPLKNPLMRSFGGFAFYLLLPLMALMFAWKAAVFPVWGSNLSHVAVAVIAGHLMLPLRKLAWQQRILFGAGAVIISAGLMANFGPLRRPFHLFRANLSDQWLLGSDFRGADLALANLTRANLTRANLSGAIFTRANLTGANLTRANLGDANLDNADLGGANLTGAIFTRANLTGANLTRANLSDANLDNADLGGANLTGARLTYVILTGATLTLANLTGANLGSAVLTGADLGGADLTGAKGLIQRQVDATRCNIETKLPPGLKPGASCKEAGW